MKFEITRSIHSRWWMIFVSGLFALVWWSCFSIFFTGIPVGLAFSPGQDGDVGLVMTSDDHADQSVEMRKIPASGRISFNVPCTASGFAFRLNSDRTKTFNLEGVCLFGFIVLDSLQISRFQMAPRLYNEIPERGRPLVLHVGNSGVLNLPNVFLYIQRFASASRKCLSLLGGLIVAVFWLTVGAKRILANAGSLLIDNPILLVSCLLAELLLTFPKPVWPMLPDLDNSWEWLFNYVAFSRTVGRDMVFTYGPLGFLIHPELNVANVLCGIIVNIVFMTVFATCTWHIYRSGRKISAYLLLVCFAFPWPNQMEWKWCAISLMACAIPCMDGGCSRSLRRILFLLSASLSVLETFVKFSSFISVVSTQFLLLSFFVFRTRRGWREVLVTFIIPWTMLFGLLGIFLFDGLSSLCNWFVGSVEIARGYNDYMVVDKSIVELSYPVLLLVVVSLVLFVRSASWKTFGFFALFSPVLYSATKYAWIRQGPIPLCMLMATLPCLLPIFESGKERRVFATCVGSLAFAVAAGFLWGGMDGASGLSIVNLRDTLMPLSAIQRAQSVSRQACEPHRLPESWRNRIGIAPVMFAGYGYGAAMVDKYTFVPFPATQLYSAYTSWLDKWCADVVSSDDRAPQFLVVCSDPCSFFYQNVFLDNPAFWAAVYAHYQYVDSTDEYTLLSRRHAVRELPDCAFVLRVHGPCVEEKLRSLLFRPERYWLLAEFDDGEHRIYAVNPHVLQKPLCTGFLPRNRKEFGRVFQELPVNVNLRTTKMSSTML